LRSGARLQPAVSGRWKSSSRTAMPASVGKNFAGSSPPRPRVLDPEGWRRAEHFPRLTLAAAPVGYANGGADHLQVFRR